MSSDSVCRICLGVDAHNNMLSLIPVQDLYEKVTNNRLHNSTMPVAACYICYAQLRRCYRFMVKSMIADDILVELLQTQTAITPKSVSLVNRKARGLVSSLMVTSVRHEEFPVKPEIHITVKSEPKHDGIEIKVEVDEDMAVSDADCRDNSLANIPIKVERNERPGASNAANIPEACISQALPLEVSVEIKEEPTEDDIPGEKLKKRQIEELETHNAGENYTKTNDGNYQCKICSKILTVNYGLCVHLRSHEGDKTYECNICQMKFNCKSSMKKHLKSHPVEKPTKCHICHRVCSTASNLKKHLLTHTGEKPHECNVCSRKFSQVGNLKMHLRTHTGEKPYVCSLCHLEFRLMGALMKHERTHTGEKPFECEFCHSSFGQMSTLTRHKRIHTGERPYECHLCDWKFSDSTTLKRHLATH